MTDGACGVPILAFWYALRTLSNRERSVLSALGRVGLEGFLPTYSERVKWSDREKTVERVLFPGYVFARLDPFADLPAALELSGVVSVLPSNLRPAVISENEIENVRLAISSMLPLKPSAVAIGDKVVVKHGPLRGASGVVVRQADGVKLVINVEMLGRALAVKLDAADLSKTN